jgi:hypothetical protein
MNRRSFDQILGVGLSASEFGRFFAKPGQASSGPPSPTSQARVSYDLQKRTLTLSNAFLEREMSLDSRRGLVSAVFRPACPILTQN